MIKNEQSRGMNQHKRPISITSIAPPLLPPPSIPMLPPTSGILSQRLTDSNAVDITSVKGQFAWEKIPHGDTYIPILFRHNTKYFCVRMLRKILPDYPEDAVRRSLHYHYLKPIPVYPVTLCEIELLNRINGHHSRWTYSRQPFSQIDELVRVSDFLPFYEHLRNGHKPTSTASNVGMHTLRQLLPQTQQTVQRPADFMNGVPSILRAQSTATPRTTVPISSFSLATELPRENISTTSRPIAPVPNLSRPVRPQKPIGNPYATLLPQSLSIPPSRVPSSNTSIVATQPFPTSTISNVYPSPTPIISNIHPLPSSSTTITSTTQSSPSSSAVPLAHRKSSTSSTSSSSTPLSAKSSRLHCGWLQVNKLYTPYISPSATNHHLYKLPISLLSFYQLLKTTTSEGSDPKECLVPFEQTLATSEELEMINGLCVKHNIQPFNADTKLIDLSTFYRYCSENMIFLKELPLNEPKASICKEWASIIQINGGICRLRNISNLHEQTVPFIGNTLLKNFLLSSPCLSTASLTKPTPAELEFLQMILFFSNMSVNLRHAQLIDIESVRKEYNVDLILLFNDKFPLNVLEYQRQGNRYNPPQTAIIPPTSTAPTNTIAESTPPPSPPSPPSPPTNHPSTNPPSQMPLTSSSNRYYKSVEFHGHTLTAYICSGLETNSYRECVSIKSLCNILYPDSPSIEKLEAQMLRLLRAKNVNRFRPQNQQSLGLTRLIDIKDAEKHWEYIKQEMRSTITDNAEVNIRSSVSSTSTESSKASTVERVETNEQPSPPPLPPPAPSEPPVNTSKGEKRPLDEPLEEEDTPMIERINKRVKFVEKENKERLDTMETEKGSPHRTIKIKSTKNKRKQTLPSNRIKQQSKATWVRKYGIEECCIRMNQYDPIYDNGTE